MARAAAPRIPTAWVAWAAAPVNSDMEAEGVMLIMLSLAVGVPVIMAEDISEAMEEAADSTAEEASDMTEEAMEEAEAAAEDAMEAAADVALATAELAMEGAALAPGMLMGTPAALQVSWTAEMALAWSSCSQAPWTQGWTLPRSSAPFLQWHSKSVREEQPSLWRGARKH